MADLLQGMIAWVVSIIKMPMEIFNVNKHLKGINKSNVLWALGLTFASALSIGLYSISLDIVLLMAAGLSFIMNRDIAGSIILLSLLFLSSGLLSYPIAWMFLDTVGLFSGGAHLGVAGGIFAIAAWVLREKLFD